MSYRVVEQAMARLHQNEILVFPSHLAQFQMGVEKLAGMTFEQGVAQMKEMQQELSNNYSVSGQSESASKPFAFANGLAVIPIHGSLLNRFSGSYGSATGYNFIRSQMRAALADEDVKGIVFDVNSPGGEAAGCFELAEEIRASRDVKPSLALVDTLCASAAYALASAASKMSVVRSGNVGSIGVLCMHANISGLLENFGIKMSIIHSGKHKIDGNPFEELPESVRADMQAGVDELRGEFVKVVAENRDMDEKVVYDTEAKVYRGEKSVKIGLADEVSSVQNAVSSFLSALPGASTTLEKSDMTDKTTAAAPGVTDPTAAAKDQPPVVNADAIRAEEQARCQGILACDEAKANPSLAQHLAFKTNMSVDQAKEMLSASVPATPAKTESANPLAVAMDAATQGQPTVEPGAAKVDENDVLAQFDAANYQATGRKAKAA